jgi:hypothetical protein
VGDVADDGQVVRDEDRAELLGRLQLGDQVQDLGLHRDVEGGDDLVEEYEPGLGDQRPGDRHPLALTAGQLVGEPVADRTVEPDDVELFVGLAPPLLAGSGAADRHRLRHRRGHP